MNLYVNLSEHHYCHDNAFQSDGSVNYEAAVELAKKYADEGSGILLGATTGEGAS